MQDNEHVKDKLVKCISNILYPATKFNKEVTFGNISVGRLYRVVEEREKQYKLVNENPHTSERGAWFDKDMFEEKY